MKTRILIVVALAASLATFCKLGEKAREKVGERLAEKAIEKATGGKVNIDGQKVTLTDDKGQTVVMGAGAPQNLPKDLPVYPGATTEGGVNVTGGEGGGVMLIAKTKDSPDQVLAYYQAEMPKAGWKIATTVQSGEGHVLMCEKDDRFASIIIGKEGDMSSVTLTSGTKQGAAPPSGAPSAP